MPGILHEPAAQPHTGGFLQAILRMFDYVHEHADLHYHAFFSSELGGVVTEPALMMVHIVSPPPPPPYPLSLFLLQPVP